MKFDIDDLPNLQRQVKRQKLPEKVHFFFIHP